MGRPVPATVDDALSVSHMRDVLSPIAGEQLDAGSIDSLSIEPHGRRLIRYTIGKPGRAVVGKVYETAQAGERGFDVHRRLWEDDFCRRAPEAVRIPEPYAYVAELRLLLMEQVPGRSLKKLIKKRFAGVREMRLLAAALAKLHDSTLVVGPPFGVEEHLLVRCAGLTEELAETVPELAGGVRRIVAAARELQSQQGSLDWTLTHGDFHFAQAHLEGNRLWILDLDPLHHGDPAYDLAMAFVAFKQLERKLGEPDYLRLLRDAFVEGYFEGRDWRLAGRIPLHEALICLKRACKRLRWQDETGWRETVRAQTRQADGCLDAMESSPPPQCAAALCELYDRSPGGM